MTAGGEDNVSVHSFGVETDEIAKDGKHPALGIQPGPTWHSFEQLRLAGPDSLRQGIGVGDIARLQVKGDEFVIMRAETFSELYGLAQDADRLGDGLHLVRQAAALSLATGGSQLATEHLHDLLVLLPEFTITEVARATDLVFDEDECADTSGGDLDFELEPANVERPRWTSG